MFKFFLLWLDKGSKPIEQLDKHLDHLLHKRKSISCMFVRFHFSIFCNIEMLFFRYLFGCPSFHLQGISHNGLQFRYIIFR